MTSLHHEIIRPATTVATRRILFLHGIYGAGRNWRSVARAVVGSRPDWRAVLVDLRGHGQSLRLQPHTLLASALDIVGPERAARGDSGAEALLNPHAILGHSFGGKVALLCAREGVGRSPLELWVIDSNPGTACPGGAPWRMLGTIRRHPGPFSSRAEAQAAVESEGFDPRVARWMVTNLRRCPQVGAWRWNTDADAMEDYLRDYFAVDAWSVIDDPPQGCRVHVVKATRSDVLGGADVGRIKRAGARTGRVFFHEVQGGHWVHSDNPDALATLLARHLGSGPPGAHAEQGRTAGVG